MREKIVQNFQDWKKANKQTFWDLSDKLWEMPELPLEEYEASDNIIKVLKDNGFTVEKGIEGMETAFIAEYRKGKIVAGFNCEYDGLPGLSQKIKPTKEPVVENAPGHGCGHNILGVAAVYCAIALKDAIEKYDLDASLIVFGSPAEEICVGTPMLGRTGRFKDADFFIDWHPSYANDAGYRDTPAYFSTKYHFKGKSSHGDMPWQGRSALDAVILLGQATEFLREHIKPRLNSNFANSLNYTFPDVGPEIPNTVPDRATTYYIGRCATADQMEEVMERLDKCAEGIAMATETTFVKEPVTALHEMLPNKTIAEIVHKNLQEIGTPEFTEEEQEFAKKMQAEAEYETVGLDESIQPFRGSTYGVTDSAEYSWNAPYTLFEMATSPPPGYHHWLFTAACGGSIGKKCLDKAAELIFLSAVDLFLDPKIVDKAKDELKERLAGREYKVLLPGEQTPDLTMNREAMEKYRSRLEEARQRVNK